LIPEPPFDASILAIYQSFAAHQDLPPERDSALRAFFGDSPAPFSYLLESAEHISAQPFRGRLNPSQLRFRHSLSRVLRVGLNVEYDDKRLLAVPKSERSSNASKPHPLRSCPSCVAGDVSRYGLAYWRLSHQWLPLRTCLVHGLPLEADCASCDGPRQPNWLRQRAEMPCRSCGGRAKRPLAIPDSEIYAQYCMTFNDVRWGCLGSDDIDALMQKGAHASLLREWEDDAFYSLAKISAMIEPIIGRRVDATDAKAIKERRFCSLGRPPSLRLGGIAFWRWLLKGHDGGSRRF